ncbi:low temperature requirement protein A [Arthrobacter sp. MSA 4-2]|uniref:low temperature requirement protein A n=1 Tax=Arthrobacter sp. MSA 4-2 TaxID=2794349 RepID=UPI0018E8C0E4|nr:low temperature requirement protein A [Arthrobacter sp. MSA 4-2]MBJ2120400.1 low temperature requirement protein A [Arthrobacter sp. MSA 4-2]
MFPAFRSMRQIRVSDESHRVTTFELFFDLVFVFAFTQVTGFMAHEHTGLGVLQGMIILGILWWSWVCYSWLANQTHVDEGIVRLGMSLAMMAMFIAALTIPEAFHDMAGGLDGPLVFALAYFVVRLVHIGLYLVAAGDDVPLRRQVIKTSSAMFTGSAIIITGALVGGPSQTWFWLAGLAADITLTYLTSAGGNWRVHSAAHWAERYGLVVILALGESIISIGVGASERPVSTLMILGAVFGVGLSICLWWLYFDVMAIAAEHVLARLRGRARSALAVDAYTYLHLPLIAGVVLSALGVEDALAHLDESSGYGWLGAGALLGGTALYLLAHAAFWRRVGGYWKTWRLSTAAVLLALIPATSGFAPLAALGLVFGLCALLVVVETTVYAEKRAEIRRSHSPA